MDTINYYIERIEKASEKLIKETQLLKKHNKEYDFESLALDGKRGARISSDLYLSYRQILLSLCSFFPRHFDSNKVYSGECEMMDVSVERLEIFDFPVYKISFPVLLPNIRRQHAEFNNALTVSIKEAVKRYCREHRVQPFKCATMIILTYGGNPRMMVDNDNKEASMIQNGMIQFFFYDDSPASCNNIYYFKRVDSKEEYRTEIYLVDSEHDIEVMKMIKDM